MAKLGPLESNEVCAELRGLLERLMTLLSWLAGATLVGGVAILVAVEEVVTTALDVGVVGVLGAETAVVAGDVGKTVWLLEQTFAAFTVLTVVGGHCAYVPWFSLFFLF